MQLSLALVLALAGALSASSVSETSVNGPTSLTAIREAGRCAMYDSCGHKGYFGTELPCPDNGLARKVRMRPFSIRPQGVSCGSENKG